MGSSADPDFSCELIHVSRVRNTHQGHIIPVNVLLLQTERYSWLSLTSACFFFPCIVATLHALEICRVQLNLYVCAPFGEYELVMDIDSYSGPSSTLQQRTSWLIKNGPDQVHIPTAK